MKEIIKKKTLIYISLKTQHTNLLSIKNHFITLLQTIYKEYL